MIYRAGQLDKAKISPQASLREAYEKLNSNGFGILIIVDEKEKLVGILTDGDIRRSILHQISLEEPCIKAACFNPSVGKEGISDKEALRLMDFSKSFTLNHLPIVNDQNQLIDLVLRSDLTQSTKIAKAILMAGGFGKRLYPLTKETPKPMLPVGGKPLIERTIDQLKEAGIEQVSISTHFQSEKIKDHFKDGSSFGVEISYLEENKPQGTAGALSQLPSHEHAYLVMNGDIYTGINFKSLIDFHREQHADLTIVVRQFDVKVPYGVVECDGIHVSQIREKPIYNFFVNAGIYLIGPRAHALVPSDQYFDMPELVTAALEKQFRVVSFPMMESWIDIGNPSDYEKAQEAAQQKDQS